MSLRIGFIGLGNIGKPIASHLAPAGFSTTIYDIAAEPVAELVAGGAKAAATPREVGANADIVGICVPEDKHVRAVVYGEEGLLAGMSEGGIILIHSTILPETAEEIEATAREKGVEVMDACVTGGQFRAADRELTLLIGGAEQALEKSRPYFEAISSVEPIHAGPLGCGAKLKLCINLITYVQWAAAWESATLAKSAGLSLDVLKQAGQSNGQITPMMIAYMASQDLPDEAVNSEAFQNLMLGHTRIAEKDLAWVLKLARRGDVQLPVTGLVSQIMGKLYSVNETTRNA